MANESISDELREIIEFIFSEIININNNCTLALQMGEYADSINYKDYGILFVPMQDALMVNVELGIARLFDTHKDSKYTIYKLLNKLKQEFGKDNALIPNKDSLKIRLNEFGFDLLCKPNEIDDFSIIDTLVDHYESLFNKESNELIKTITKYLKNRKDKVYSHNDKVQHLDTSLTWNDLIDTIHRIASFISCIKSIVLAIGNMITFHRKLFVLEYSDFAVKKWEKLMQEQKFTKQTLDEIIALELKEML